MGEIYVKYSTLGNNELERFLLNEGCEPVVPALLDFLLYCVVNVMNDAEYYGKGKSKAGIYKFIYKIVHRMQKKIIKIFEQEGSFEPVHDFETLRACADEVINQGVKMGEGWLIPAEMAAFARAAYPISYARNRSDVCPIILQAKVL